MPEDDFDIYGEDEGFNSTKPVEVSSAVVPQGICSRVMVDRVLTRNPTRTTLNKKAISGPALR